MSERVEFSGFDLDDDEIVPIKEAKAPNKRQGGPRPSGKPQKEKPPVKEKTYKQEKSELEKRAKSNRIKAWLIVASIIAGVVIISFAGLASAFNKTPLPEIRAYVNQSNGETAFNAAGVLAYLQDSFPQYMNEADNAQDGQDALVISNYEITRIVKITDQLAMVNFVVSAQGSTQGSQQVGWSVLLNYLGTKGYSIADNFRNVPVPPMNAQPTDTPLMSFKDLDAVDPKVVDTASAFMGNFLTNYFENNSAVVNSMYSNPSEPLVFNNKGTFKDIISLALYKETNKLGYNGLVTYEFVLDGNVIQSTKYVLLEVSPTPLVKRLL